MSDTLALCVSSGSTSHNTLRLRAEQLTFADKRCEISFVFYNGANRAFPIFPPNHQPVHIIQTGTLFTNGGYCPYHHNMPKLANELLNLCPMRPQTSTGRSPVLNLINLQQKPLTTSELRRTLPRTIRPRTTREPPGSQHRYRPSRRRSRPRPAGRLGRIHRPRSRRPR